MTNFRIATVLLLTALITLPSAAVDDTDDLKALLKAEREAYYSEYPSRLPADRRTEKSMTLSDVTPETYARRAALWAGFLDQLSSIDRDKLSIDGQVNYDLFEMVMINRQLDHNFKRYRIAFTSNGGFHSGLPRSSRRVRFNESDDYAAYLSRLKDIPRYFDDNITNLKQGMADGFTLPKIVLDGLLPTFSTFITETAEASSFYDPFKEMSKNLNAAEQDALRAEAKEVIEMVIMPAYTRLKAFMEGEYYPAARGSIGTSEMPNGPAYYERLVRYHTTLDITADEIHQIGIKEVARIRSEMEKIIKEVKFDGDFQEFLTFLRTDEQFYAKTPKELLMRASYIAKLADGRLPMLFNHLPRQPYGVEAVPDAIAPNFTTGLYYGSPKDAPRGGYYWVNTYALNMRPLYELPALTVHEGMPGHHLERALSNELDGLPEFRKGLGITAFIEGWGLYSEKLGAELGIYETPYERFGQLSYEMWRAGRLVVDTGIHAKGWTRDEAIKLFAENSALSMRNITTEVDRYIARPGQALAYKMGELKILELRARAEKALGAKFDVRVFHEQVLGAGPLTLQMLERRIDEWIAASLTTE